jgi:hypothetical protein
MKKRVYISVPMFGRKQAAVGKDVADATQRLEDMLAKDYDKVLYIVPYLLAAQVDKSFKKYGLGEPTYNDYMGYDIAVLLEKADAVAFCKGWQNSKGCRLERAAAEIYDKEILDL